MKKSIVVTIIYALVTLICVLHHEVWSDEAQVWLLCKNISFFGLFRHLVNEGHPSLFYLMVMPFAKLFDDIIFQKIICWLLCVASVFLLWRYTKFSNLAKTVITLSSPFIYHFPVIARNYSLVPFFIILLAILQPKIKEHPVLYALVLAALANTHAIMFPFAFILGAYFFYKYIFKEKDREKGIIIGALIIALGLLALVAQLAGTTDSNVAITFKRSYGVNAVVRVISLFFFNSFDDYLLKYSNNYFTPYSLTMLGLTIAAYIVTFCTLFKQSKKLFILAALSILAQFIIYITAYSFFVFPTRIYCAYMIVLFCFILLINSDKKKLVNFTAIFLFGMTLVNSAKSYYGDIMFDYSPSKKTAEYILKNIDVKNSDIFICDPGYEIAIAYYLYPKADLIYVRSGKPLRYVVWDDNMITIIPENILTSYLNFQRKNGNKKQLYVLVGHNPFLNLDWYGKDYELVFEANKSIMPTEAQRLYKYKK